MRSWAIGSLNPFGYSLSNQARLTHLIGGLAIQGVITHLLLTQVTWVIGYITIFFVFIRLFRSWNSHSSVQFLLPELVPLNVNCSIQHFSYVFSKGVLYIATTMWAS